MATHSSVLPNPRDGGAWWAAVYGVAESRTRLKRQQQQQQQQVGHRFSSKEQASFNFMAAVTICSDFGDQKDKVSYCFCCFPIYLS